MSNSEQQPSAQSQSFLRWFRGLVVIGLVLWLASTVYQNAINENAANPFKLGLDLAGGSHLVYVADTSEVDPLEVPELMSALRDVIERRVNIFGVSEPIVQVESSSFVSGTPSQRLVVELPGVTDVSEAVAEIGRTPLLEFKLYDDELADQQVALDGLSSISENDESSEDIATSDINIEGEGLDDEAQANIQEQVEAALAESQARDADLAFVDTGLTGRYLESSQPVQQGPVSESAIQIVFNKEGKDLFAEITRNNVGQQLGIFLDGELLSAPVINEAIVGGTAIISGSFTSEEARDLSRNLSFGALPVAIELQSTQTVGASLGAEVLGKGMKAGVSGLSLVILFMLLWYRLPGLVAGIALMSYITIMLALFQMVPVTLTAAGLAGFVLSLGMAVDANVLVFERMKEEYRNGSSSRKAAEVGFKRAWSAIRDGNITSLLSATILFWFGTSMVKGFALVFGIGIIISMLSALIVTRTLLLMLPDVKANQKTLVSKLLDSGLKN
jgi:protein-export membrane protein SecD